MSDYIKFHEGHNCINIDPHELELAPFKTNDGSNPDSNNGLITTIWGPPEWDSFHAFTFGFPIDPTEEQKIKYLVYYILKGDVLPCKYCRESYKKFIKEPDTLLDMNTVKSRETLTKWGHRLHNAVNRKLGVDYGETYEEMCYRYESFRAKCTKTDKGCLMPLNMKAKSYQKAAIHRAPIIDVKYCKALEQHAETLGITNFKDSVDYFSSIRRNSIEWGLRDCAARKIINHMRKNGKSSLDSNGLPSSCEMMLISLLSSTLENKKLEEIYNRLSDFVEPVIDVKYCSVLEKHAETLKIKDFKDNVDYFSSIAKNSEEWQMRERAVKKIKSYMKKNNLSSLDANGMPTFYEMMLITLLSSTLENKQLEEICNRQINS